MNKKQKDIIRAEFIRRHKKIPIMVRYYNWYDTLDNYLEQEKYRRPLN
jgi:hypothetical protein